MVTSFLNKSGDATAHYFIVIILLLLIILALVAWNWVTDLPGPLKSVIGWAALVFAVLLAAELLPWQQYAIVSRQVGLEALKWLDDRPLIVLLVLPALLFGSLFWQKPA